MENLFILIALSICTLAFSEMQVQEGKVYSAHALEIADAVAAFKSLDVRDFINMDEFRSDGADNRTRQVTPVSRIHSVSHEGTDPVPARLVRSHHKRSKSVEYETDLMEYYVGSGWDDFKFGEDDSVNKAWTFEIPEGSEGFIKLSAEQGSFDVFSAVVNGKVLGPTGKIAPAEKLVEEWPGDFAYNDEGTPSGEWRLDPANYTLEILVTKNIAASIGWMRVDINSKLYFSMNFGHVPNVNTLIFTNMTATSDSQGRVFVGGDATLTAFSIGDKMPALDSTVETEDDKMLIVGGSLWYRSGEAKGDIVFGEKSVIDTSVINGLDLAKKTAVEDPYFFDFHASKFYYGGLTDFQTQVITTGIVKFEEGNTLVFRPSYDESLLDTDPEYFEVMCSDILSARTILMEQPEVTRTYIINIYGAGTEEEPCGFVSTEFDVSNSSLVLFVFPEAEEIIISEVNVKGSILAPFSHVNALKGVITGMTVANSWYGTTQQNLQNFVGNIKGPSWRSVVASPSVAPSASLTASRTMEPSISVSASYSAYPSYFPF